MNNNQSQGNNANNQANTSQSSNTRNGNISQNKNAQVNTQANTQASNPQIKKAPNITKMQFVEIANGYTPPIDKNKK